MYALEIYSGVGTGTTRDILYSGDFVLDSWSLRINGAGKLSFSMNKYHSKATPENLRKHRQIRLFRKPRDGSAMVPVWYGYIEAEREIEGRKEVLCVGMLDLFRKRYTDASRNMNGQGSTEAFSLLTYTNNPTYAGQTGVSSGSGGVTSTKDLTVDKQSIFSTWELLAAAHDAEFRINPDTTFDFVSALGTDKSSSIELKLYRDGSPGTNIEEIEIGEDAKNMANRLIGFTSSLTSTYNDTTSQSEFGDSTNDLVLEHRRSFTEANDQDTLDTMTQRYGEQISNPLTDILVMPKLKQKQYNPITNTRELVGIEYDDVELGDLITLIVVSANRNTSETKRIAEIEVLVDENKKETLNLTLSKSGVFITAAYLDSNEVEDIKKRLRALE